MMNSKELHELIEKYFDARTSTEEEKLLLDILLHWEEDDAMADEALAVMGYARVRPSARKSAVRKKTFQRIAAAACLCGLLAIAGLTFLGDNGTADVEFYAYVDGVRIEDENRISSLVLSQMSEMSEANETVMNTISEDMGDFGEAFKEEEL